MKRIAVLAYHKVGPPSPGGWETWYYVPVDTFEAQLARVQELGFHYIDAGDLLEGLTDPDSLPERSVLVTLDDAYRSLVECACPVLTRLRCPATVFVPTAFIGALNDFDADSREPAEPICDWDDLRALQQAGISLQSHGVTHRSFSDLKPQEILSELVCSKEALECRLNTSVEIFAFPYGDPGQEVDGVASALLQVGYRAACRFIGGPIELPGADRFALTRVPMWPDSDVEEELLGRSPGPLRTAN